MNLVWKGYRSELPKCNDFNAYGLFRRDNSHEKVASAWSKALDVILEQLLKLEAEHGVGVSISFIGLYRRPGQLDFCTLEEFRLLVDELRHVHGEICDASDGESGEEPICLTPKGREMARSRLETTRTCGSESGS